MTPNILDLRLLIAILCFTVFLPVSATYNELPTAFLPRQEHVSTPAPTTFQSAYSEAELEALSCFQKDEHDYKARFAKQYKSERGTLTRTESAYLLHLQPDDLVSAALRTQKTNRECLQ